MNLKDEKGITLTVLAITIVVLSIITGSTLHMIFDQKGILRTAKEMKDIQKAQINMQEKNTNNLMNSVNENLKQDYKDKSGANPPKLGEEMVPVKWNSEGSYWEVTNSKDEKWYDYTDKKWANVMLRDGLEIEGINKNKIQTATIDEMKGKKVTNLGSMFVWIPRYAYQIATNYHLGGKDVSGIINIKFLKGITDKPLRKTIPEGISVKWDNKSGINNWNVHPAFNFGEEVSGIWVAKFEASAQQGIGNKEELDNVSTKKIQVKPGVQSWRYINVSNIFNNCLNYKPSLNSHMMKNSEWGAVAYLTQSKYGAGENNQICINNSKNFITGASGNSINAEINVATILEYEKSQNASTTGNIYGIYDMSGGADEYVAAYIDNGNVNLNNNGISLINALDKYKDVYKIGNGNIDSHTNNYDANSNKYGDAIYETSANSSGNPNWQQAWNEDYSEMPQSSTPFFQRGGGNFNGSAAGIFCSDGHFGHAYSSTGFRPVLICF